MDRREAALALAALAATPLACFAQPPARIPRVGYLAGNLAIGQHFKAAFLRGLSEFGYVEGRNIVIVYGDAGGNQDRLPALAAELVAQGVDVILAAGTQHVLAARQATRTIPIVFADVADPVARGFVASLARPGGNITGLANLQTDLVGKWLDLLKQVVPGLDLVAFLWQPAFLPERARTDVVKRTEAAAQAASVRLRFAEVRGPGDLDQAFSEMSRARVGAVVVWGGVMLIHERRHVAELALGNRLPSCYPMSEFVDVGGLLSYAPNIADNFRRAADYVDRILKGAKPAEMPVQQPTQFELVLNLRTARSLGLAMPPVLVQRADRVIE